VAVAVVLSVIDVVGAVIVEDRRVLCAKRGHGEESGLWEFPGGKVELGESPQQALTREIAEELACEVEVGREVVTTTHEGGSGGIRLTTFLCRIVSGDAQALEHQELRWVAIGELRVLDWAPADVPTVDVLLDSTDLSSPL